MSQLIACKSNEGIVFGVDGKAVDVDANGNLIELKVDRLHQLSDYTAVLNGGAAAGELMCRSLKRFVDEENLEMMRERVDWGELLEPGATDPAPVGDRRRPDW